MKPPLLRSYRASSCFRSRRARRATSSACAYSRAPTSRRSVSSSVSSLLDALNWSATAFAFAASSRSTSSRAIANTSRSTLSFSSLSPSTSRARSAHSASNRSFSIRYARSSLSRSSRWRTFSSSTRCAFSSSTTPAIWSCVDCASMYCPRPEHCIASSASAVLRGG